jgi:hypothetical protein
LLRIDALGGVGTLVVAALLLVTLLGGVGTLAGVESPVNDNTLLRIDALGGVGTLVVAALLLVTLLGGVGTLGGVVGGVGGIIINLGDTGVLAVVLLGLDVVEVGIVDSNTRHLFRIS